MPGLTALEVVAYCGRLAGMPARDAFKRAHEVVSYVGLREERYRETSGFSVGMQQRLKLAAALVHDPDVLLLDEPTNGLDPQGRAQMIALIREMVTVHGKHLLLSSHLLPDVEQVCTDVVVLRAGCVVQRGPIAQLTGAAADVFQVALEGDAAAFRAAAVAAGATVVSDAPLRLRLPGDGDTGLLFRASREAGVRIRGLGPVRRSLEDVFFDAMETRDAG
jgi:ABC-2 type transport system ATP-binding protein